MSHIEECGVTYDKVAKWCTKQKLDKLAEKCIRVHKKLTAGGSVMRHVTTIPKDRIGAFVGHLPTKLTHPKTDRYLSVRECMSIMGMPADFELIDPKRQLNHICQNVPVGTATDAASEVRAVLEGKRDSISGNLICQFNAKRNWVELDESMEPTNNLAGFIL
jgi:site-specific DNA-cytosine methylase